jgi:hypothetical protein
MIDTQRSSPRPDPSTLLTLAADNADEAEALSTIEAFAQAQAMLDAARLKFVNRYVTVRGDHNSAQNILASKRKISTAKAGNDISLAYALTTRLPETFARLAEGQMNYDKARQVARATTDLTSEKTLEIDAALYPSACEMTPCQLSELLRSLIGRIDPHAVADRAKKRKPGRRISLGRNVEMSWLHVFMASDDVLAIDQRLNLIAQRILQTGDERTLNQLRADTARDLLLGKLAGNAITHLYLASGATSLEDVPEQRRRRGPISGYKVRRLGRRFKALWSGDPRNDGSSSSHETSPEDSRCA